MPGRRSKSQKKTQGKTQHEKAGVRFPVGRIGRMLRHGNYTERVGASAPVMLAGVLEYLAQEVLELAGNCCIEDKRARITPRHLQLAIRHDDELNKLMMNTTISNGGVLHNVHKFLSKDPDARQADAV